MPRPCKNRFVSGEPVSIVYKPAGIPANTLDWVNLTLDEFECIRLLDYNMLNQEQAAEKLGVSRPTVTRIYSRARQKIADAIVSGKAIKIEGGQIQQQTPPLDRCGGIGKANGHRHRRGQM